MSKSEAKKYFRNSPEKILERCQQYQIYIKEIAKAKKTDPLNIQFSFSISSKQYSDWQFSISGGVKLKDFTYKSDPDDEEPVEMFGVLIKQDDEEPDYRAYFADYEDAQEYTTYLKDILDDFTFEINVEPIFIGSVGDERYNGVWNMEEGIYTGLFIYAKEMRDYIENKGYDEDIYMYNEVYVTPEGAI